MVGTVRAVPRSADETRRSILDAAERRFAADGIVGATFADIIDDADQRNNSAIQYHFGDRIGLLEAVTMRRVEEMALHREKLVAALGDRPTPDELVEVIVAPLAAMLTTAGGSGYLRIQAELLAHPSRESLPTMLAQPWSRPGLAEVLALLAAALPDRPQSSGTVRRDLVTSLIFHSLADRARSSAAGDDHTEFVRGLIGATVAILEMPAG